MVANKLLFQRDDGFFDREGNRYNEDGLMIDAEGNVIVEEIIDDQEQQRAREQEEAEQARVRDRQLRVDRHRWDVDRHEQIQGVARHDGQIARHHAQNRTLADFNRPEQFYANRAAIRPPAFQRNDFELKPAYFSLVAQDPFCGLPHEHPMDHIERFEDLASSIKANGVSEDYLFCKLFPYSLHGEAKHWLRTLPPGSLTNWEDTKNAFLSNFFDDAKSEDLRYKITTFKQGDCEAFKAAWIRFKGYQRDCPHHGFNEVQLLSIFFRGIAMQYAVSLDAASRGDFNTNSPEAALRLIENLANSNNTKNLDFERGKSGQNINGSQLAEVSKKLDTMTSLLSGKKTVQFAQEVQTFEPEDVNFVNSSGYQRFNSQGFGSSSYQKPFQSSHQRDYGSSSYQKPPPPSAESKMEAMMERVLEGQQKMTVDFNGKLDSIYTDLNGKLDSIYTDLNGKIESLNIHVKKLDTQVAQTSESVKKYHSNMLSLRSGTAEKRAPRRIDRFTEEEEAAIFGTEAAMSIDTANVSIDEKEDSRVERHAASVARHQPQNCPKSAKASVCSIERVYKPHLPFPRATAKPCESASIHCSKQEPKIVKEPVLRELPKSEDPWQFIIPCSINGKELEGTLLDTGANVNVISHDVMKQLGISSIQPSSALVGLVNSSSVAAIGFIPDLKIRIGDCLVPADFHIIETTKPMVLGASFLTSIGAILDYPNERISFTKINKEVFYPAILMDNFSCWTVLKGEKLDPVSLPTPKPPNEQRYTLPVLNSKSLHPNFMVEKAVMRSCKQRVSRRMLGFSSDECAGIPKECREEETGEKIRKRASKAFSKFRIIIPSDLKEKGEEIIQQMLKNTMELFPRIVSDKSGGAGTKSRMKNKAASSIQDKGSPVLPQDPP